MKKPSKKKRISPRRKPLKSRGLMMARFAMPSPANFDRLDARDRAMRERMPPEVQAEWDRLMELTLPEGHELDPVDEDRLDELLEQYEGAASEEDIARHVADIVREREAREAAPEPSLTE